MQEGGGGGVGTHFDMAAEKILDLLVVDLKHAESDLAGQHGASVWCQTVREPNGQTNKDD